MRAPRLAVARDSDSRWRRHSLRQSLEVFEAVCRNRAQRCPNRVGVWPCCSCRPSGSGCSRPANLFCENSRQKHLAAQFWVWRPVPVIQCSRPLGRQTARLIGAMAGASPTPRLMPWRACCFAAAGRVGDLVRETWGPEVRRPLLASFSGRTWFYKGCVRSEVLPAFYKRPERRAFAVSSRRITAASANTMPRLPASRLRCWATTVKSNPCWAISTAARAAESHLDAAGGARRPLKPVVKRELQAILPNLRRHARADVRSAGRSRLPPTLVPEAFREQPETFDSAQRCWAF